MKAVSFLEGVIVALLASVIGSVVFCGLSWLVSDAAAIRFLIIGLALAYLLYLFSRSRELTGRITTLLVWLVMTVIAVIWQLPLVGLLILQIGIIWLIRSLYFHNGLLTALADLGLNTFALAAAFWALQQSGSIVMTLWCFFLAQALFVFLISDQTQAYTDKSGFLVNESDFHRAYQAAQAAVRKLSSTNI